MSEVRIDARTPREGYAPAENTELFFRVTGQGRPIVVIHGGPDFDHNYLLPEMDRLSDSFRLIYYDQRGRGKSVGHVQPVDVSIESEVRDLEALRRYLDLESISLLGHSWGAVLAMEYAVRHPDWVSHLILMNPAPASQDDFGLLRQARRNNHGAEVETLKRLSSNTRYQEGDLEAEAEYYRVHFRESLSRPEHLERLMERLRANFTKESVLKARDIERRLMDETLLSSGYNLLPKLQRLHIPTLILHGTHDALIPAECAAHIAQAIPGAHLIVLRNCGHFAYLESPDEVKKVITDFLGISC